MSRGYAKCSADLLRFPLSGPTGGSGITAVDVIVVDLEDSDGAGGTGFSYVLGGGGATVLATCRDLLDRQGLWRPDVYDRIVHTMSSVW